ncbi:hypothetical protein K493DRAFT_409116 [Basidiobolus meristosporus CBS 931.73]|uniref:DNA/RNA-binding protein Alba-like domain-containing protein n=1 Tax=Basidiobolus meristosporus CBS 931.73 TaxID=1314790 RepID=A0A1Y1Y2K0_9FUNG|nr:hypothetical protein K493DRAFT_409116 [Basidiobolus meristosporus CBS 931.73]|eukprot:ORX91844.1 hypothetical protein K493DRAFT_409116 [Basidiobolus meristosporus CBS 931.73]
MSDVHSKAQILGLRKENEIHITSHGKIKSYISYATKLLEEKKHESILFLAKGNAVTKAISVVEIFKRLKGDEILKQETTIDAKVLDNTPEESATVSGSNRRVPILEITLFVTQPSQV